MVVSPGNQSFVNRSTGVGGCVAWKSVFREQVNRGRCLCRLEINLSSTGVGGCVTWKSVFRQQG